MRRANIAPIYDRAIQRGGGAGWRRRSPSTTEDRAFQLLGLKWTGAELRRDSRPRPARWSAEQRPDGGWSQLPSLASDAYATGQALVALVESGAITTADPAYKRGAQFLLDATAG